MIRHLWKAIRNATIGFIVGVFLMTAIQIVWWQFVPYPTADVTVPIEVLNANNEVQRGGDIMLLVIFDKQSDITPEVSRNIICNTGNIYGVETAMDGRSRPTGKFVAEVEFRLTENAKVGEICYFQFQNDYKVNPIRTIRKVWQSEPFTVI